MRGLALALVGAAALAAPASAQTDAARALARGDRLRAAFRTAEAIDAYRIAQKADRRDPVVRGRLAAALADRALETPGREGDGPLLEEAVVWATRAMKVDREDARAHANLAVALGRYGEWLARERRLSAAETVVETGKMAVHHATLALELDPDEPVAHAFLGSMHRRLATLPAVVRTVADGFVALPDVSLEASARHLERSVRADPGRVASRLELARTYLAMDREADARRQLVVTGAAVPGNALDRIRREEAARLLADLDEARAPRARTP